MSSMNDDDLVLLVDRYLDGELSPEDRRRLTSDTDLVQRFIAELRFQGRVGGLLKPDGRALLGQIEDALALGRSTDLADRILAKLPQRHGVHWWRWAAGIAAAAGLGLAVLVLPMHANTTPVIAAVVDGVNEPSEKVALTPGRLLELDVNQEANVAFKDGTRMDLGATAAVRLNGIDQGGARIALESGSLTAEVTKQPKGSHFQVKTKEALLTVLGTKFTATKYPWGTRVEVTEGRVRTKRETDGKEVEVGAGSRVDVGPGTMDLQPIRPPLPADALVLEPIADSVVVGGKYGDENRGTRPGHVVTSQKTKADELRDYYLRFDLTQVTAAPERALLHLHLILLRPQGVTLHLARVDQPWDETAITWNNRPARGDHTATWKPDRSDAPIDLTAFVAANLGKVVDLCLYIDADEKPNAIVGFNTREAPPIMRPRLVIEP